MAHSKLYIKLMNAKEWREIRNAKLNANPLCERCARKGYVTPARVIHHIREIESGLTDEECRQLAYSMSNLQSLCYECHHEVHSEARYNTKQQHQERESDRLRQWVARHGVG